MKDINYREEDWQEAKSALAPFTEANWWGGLFNNLEDVSKNMEVAEEDILDLDSDRAISFQHKNYQDKYGEIEDDLKVLYKFSSHAGERIETLIDEPFYKKLDAFVDGMQDLSITTYSTTNRIGAKSTQTYTTSDGTSQVIESVKENATIEDLMNGDNFYANQMNLQYEAWKRANPDQDVSEADFKMGMLHTRAFDYKSIKDKQEEKEFWVNIVATVVMVGVSIVCPPAGLALGIGYGALEASSAITGKDWISGRELSNQERLLRGGFALLDIIPGVKAFSSGAKIASTGSKMLRVGDDLLGGGKLAIKNAGKQFQGTIDNGIQAGKKALDIRIPNVKKVTDNLAQEAKKKLTQDLDDIGTAAKTIQAKAKEAFQMPPRERLAFAGVGDDISGQTATGTISAAQKKLRDMMSKMDDLNIKGSGTGDIIGGASGLNKIDNIDVIDGRVGGKIPVDDFQKMRQSSLHNTNADSMTLGKYTPTIENGVPNWSKAGPDSYIGKAGKDSMYFDLGDDWASIQKQYNLSDTEMFEYLNKPALDDAISSGKEIKFSHNPLDYDNGFIVDEWEYIKETLNVTDDNLVKNGDFWYVKQ